jgi:hypothetical protein
LATTKPPEDDSKLLVEIVRAGVDVDLTPTQAAAYGKTAARLNTIRAGATRSLAGCTDCLSVQRPGRVAGQF